MHNSSKLGLNKLFWIFLCVLLFNNYTVRAQSVLDASIEHLVAPLAPHNNELEFVKIRIKNTGNVAISSVGVKWKINGVLQLSNFSQNITIPVASGSTVDPTAVLTLPIGTIADNFTNVYEFYIERVNNALSSNTKNDTLRVQFDAPLSGIKTIGAINSDYKTIGDAVNAIKYNGIAGNLTFKIKEGIYTDPINLKSSEIYFSTIPNPAIRFESFSNKRDVLIVSEKHIKSTVLFDGVKNASVCNLRIKNTNEYIGIGIQYVNIANNGLVKNCEVIVDSISNVKSFAGICLGDIGPAPEYGIIHVSKVNYTRITNCTITGGAYGIMAAGYTTIPDTLSQIDSNDIRQVSMYGILAQNQINTKINKNKVVFRPSANFMSAGIHLKAVRTILPGIITVSQNYVRGAGFSGIYLLEVIGIGFPNNRLVDVSNNMIAGGFLSNSTISAEIPKGIYLQNSGSVNVYFNSVIMDAPVNRNVVDNTSALYLLGTPSLGIINVLNNNLINSNKGYAYYNASSAGQNPVLNTDHNNYWVEKLDTNSSPSTGFAYWDGSVRMGLQALQVVNNRDKNSISIDPQFLSSTDLHTYASGLNQKGSAFTNTTVGVDFDGDLRDQFGNPDIGADEIIQGGNDFAILDVGPRVFKLNQPTPWNITIGYFGPNAGNGAIYFRYKIDGVDQLLPDSAIIYMVTNLTNYKTLSFNVPIPRHITRTNTNSFRLTVYISAGNFGDLQAKNDTFSVDVCVGLDGTYTLDPNGSGPRNFLSFTDLLDKLQCGIAGPTTIEIAEGVYRERIVLGDIPNTSLANSLTFTSKTKNASNTIITSNEGTEAKSATFTLNGSKHIKISNLCIENKAMFFGSAIQLTGNSQFNTIEHNIIRMDTINQSVSSNLFAIVASNLGTISLSTLPKNANNTIIRNNKIAGGYHSIYLMGKDTNMQDVGNVIEANTITSFREIGINLNNSNANILNNTIIGRGSSELSRTGIALNGLGDPAGRESIGIDGNNIKNVHTYGILVTNCRGFKNNSPKKYTFVLSNNMIGGVFSSNSESVTGINIVSSHSTMILHNTIYLNAPRTSSTVPSESVARCLRINNTNNEIEAHNNIFYSTNGAIPLDYYSKIGTSGLTGTGLVSSNNNLFFTSYINSTSTPLILIVKNTNVSPVKTVYSYNQLTQTPYYALSVFRNNSTNGSRESKSLAIPIDFFDAPNNLHTYDLQLEGKASKGFAVSKDIDKQLRGGNPDIGADEIVIASQDLELSSISNAALNANKPNEISIKITNHGQSDILNKQTILQYTVRNLNNTLIASVADTINITLNVRAEMVYKFTKKLILPGTNTYLVCAKANLISDTVLYNNEKCKEICTGIEGDYYVGFNRSSPIPNTDTNNYFASITEALQNLKCGLVGETTIHLNPLSSPYIERVSIPKIALSIDSPMLTIKGYNTTNSSDVVIQQTSTGSQDYLHHTIQFNGAQNVRLQYLKIINNNPGFGSGIHFTNNASNNIVQNCLIETNNNETGDLFYGIAFTSPNKLSITNALATGNNGSNNKILNNTINGGTSGIAILGSSDIENTKGNIIEDNHISNFSKFGVFVKFSSDFIIKRNTIIPYFQSTALTKSVAIYNANNGGLIDANNFMNYESEAIKILSVSASASKPLVISNNFFSVSTNAPVSDTLGVLAIKRSKHIYVYHNSISYKGDNYILNLSKDSIFSTSQGKYIFNEISNIRVINNIFRIDSPNVISRKPHILYYNSNDTTNYINYNAYYSEYDNLFARTRNFTYTSLQQWNSFTGKDGNSIYQLPMFVSTTDLSLSNSGLFVGKGIPLALVPKDISNNLRNPRIGSLGAIEFSTLNRNLSVFSIGINTLNYGQNQISCILLNDGQDNISADTVALEYSDDTGKTWLGYQLFKLDSLTERYKMQHITFSANYLVQKFVPLKILVRINPLKRLSNDPNFQYESAEKELCVGLNAGSYTISNTSSSADFNSIQSALNALNCNYTNHINFILETGIYQEDLFIANLSNVQNKSITFRAAPNANVIWKTFSATRESILELNDCANISFENIIFEGTKNSNFVAVHLLDSVDNIKFLNCTFNLPLTPNLNEVYAISTLRNNPFSRSSAIKNIRVENCIFNGGNTAINIKSNHQQGKNIDILNSTFNKNLSIAININASNVDSISYNKINLENSSVTSSGIRLTNLKQTFTVSNNTVLNCSDESLRIDSSNFIANAYITNNMMVSNPLRDGVNANLVSVKNFGTDPTRNIFTSGKLFFLYNSLSQSETSFSTNPSNVLNFENSNHLVLYGNIAMNNDLSPVIKFSTGNEDSTEFINTSNNLLYTNGTVLASWRGVVCANLTMLAQQDGATCPFNLQTSPKQLGSFKPIVRSNFDLHANDSRIDGSANLPSGLSTMLVDIDGEQLSNFNNDIGCDQFDLSYDLAVKEFVTPLENQTLGGTNIEVKLRLENKGKDLPRTIIKYTIDGILIDSVERIFSPQLKTDSIFTYTFAKKYNTLKPGAHILKVYVEVRELRGMEFVYADFNKANDTMSITFYTIDSADLRVQNFISPVANATILIPTKVIVRIANSGTTIIDNYKVVLTKNNVVQKQLEFVGTNNVSPNFYKDVDIDFTIIPNDNNLYEYCAYTILNGDYNHSNDTNCININTSVGLNSVNFVEIDFYPNPVLDVLTFKSTQNLQNANIKIYNTLGQMVHDGRLKGTEVDVLELLEGVYHFVLSKDDLQVRGTFVKQ